MTYADMPLTFGVSIKKPRFRESPVWMNECMNE